MTPTPQPQPDELREVPLLRVYRCVKCGNIIFKAKLPAGAVVEHKCRCNAVTSVAVMAEDAAS